MTASKQPQIRWGEERVADALCGRWPPDQFNFSYRRSAVEIPGREAEDSYAINKKGRNITVEAPGARAAMYALLEIADRIKRAREPFAVDLAGDWQWRDGPVMRYRGYCLGLQKPVAHFPDHPSYDWPITREDFPWFYDRVFLLRLLDMLAQTRINMLCLWSGHPFASLLRLADYPEAPEVGREQLEENMEQYRWLCLEAQRRGVWIVQKFYNIHMSDPLAKKRGWDIKAGVAHPEICDYTRACIREFIRTYPSVGLMACIGEYIREEEKARWLELLLDAVLDGLGPEPADYPPVIIRAHSISLEKYLPAAMERYPNLVTMMKHNNESFISTKPDSANTAAARLSGRHIINVHLCANLEPFAWGSPRFIRRTAANMVKAEAAGIHVYPLRYWDWPHSARCHPLGDQLHEHFIWWSAWGRYAWNPWRDESAEDDYWAKELEREYRLDAGQSEALLYALQETGPVLPQIAGQFVITSGNGQCINLGQTVVQLAFSRQEFQDGGGYSMGQLCGFTLLRETMWTQSPVTRMRRMEAKCHAAIERLRERNTAPILADTLREIGVMELLARYYALKAEACALYFQCLYGAADADECKALQKLEESLAVYRQIAERTDGFLKDASSFHHYRRLPASVEDGYLHWRDMLACYRREYEAARAGGIRELLRLAQKEAHYMPEWNAGGMNTDEI